MTSRLVLPVAAAGLASTSADQVMKRLPPLALYVHFPWCVRKCPYCDFNSHEMKPGALDDTHYVAALLRDLELALPQIWGRRVISVFIGGGTPSLMSPAALNHLLEGVRSRLSLLADAEITIEANPGTIDAGRFAAFRAAGVNRVSLGIQSFNDRHLAALGRIHSSADARHAIDFAMRYFDTVNLDMMYALPNQTLCEAQSDMEIAIRFSPHHVSAYHLTLEPNTAFHQTPPQLPGDDLAANMQESVEAILSGQGYEQYEVSAFAKPGHRCVHNLNYWRFGDYLGIGAGAHGKISSPDGIVREMRHRHPGRYLAAMEQADFVAHRQDVAHTDLPFEFMMNSLRLHDGVSIDLFESHTGLPLTAMSGALLSAQRRGLLTMENGWLLPTEQGRRFLNDLLEIFLPD